MNTQLNTAFACGKPVENLWKTPTFLWKKNCDLWKTVLGIYTLWKNPLLFPQLFPQGARLEMPMKRTFF